MSCQKNLTEIVCTDCDQICTEMVLYRTRRNSMNCEKVFSFEFCFPFLVFNDVFLNPSTSTVKLLN